MVEEALTTLDDKDLLEKYDSTQVALMQECCIVVDDNDKVLGFESKKKCHLNVNIEGGLLHRAFSIFLFNSEGKLLLQQRAADKITFPLYWTNTVCSHPLQFLEGEVPAKEQPEMDEKEAIGVKRAAKRKLKHELGIVLDNEERFHYLTRILYKAPSCDVWGEHEIDYVLFLQADVELDPSPNEVKDTKYVTQAELKEMFANKERDGIKMTPWFQLISENFLYGWWDQLDAIKSVHDPQIHKM